MDSISRGFRLAKASWRSSGRTGSCSWLPVISFFCSLVVMAVFALGALGIGLPENQSSRSARRSTCSAS